MNLKLLIGGLLLIAIGYLYYKFFYKKKPLYHNPNDFDTQDFIRPVSIKYPDDDEVKTIEITGDKPKKKKANNEGATAKSDTAAKESEVEGAATDSAATDNAATDNAATNVKKITVS